MARFPTTLVNTTKMVRSLTLRSTRRAVGVLESTAVPGILVCAEGARGLFLLLDELLALFAYEQKLTGFLVESRQIVIQYRVLHHAPGRLRAEIIFRIEFVYPFHELAAIKSGVDGVGKLVAARVRHAVDVYQTVGLGVFVKLGSRERVAERD